MTNCIKNLQAAVEYREKLIANNFPASPHVIVTLDDAHAILKLLESQTPKMEAQERQDKWVRGCIARMTCQKTGSCVPCDDCAPPEPEMNPGSDEADGSRVSE